MPVALLQRDADSLARAAPGTTGLASMPGPLPLPMPLPTRRPCQLSQRCPPCASLVPSSPDLDRLVSVRRRCFTGDVLCREGESFHSLFALCSGSMKAVVALPNGREQVTNFLLAGDLVALDAIASGRHTRTVTAIEDTRLCVIDYRSLRSISDIGSPLLPQHALSRQLSLEITRTHRMMLLLGCMNAQERLAAFLLDLSHRTRFEGLPACDLTLRMSRVEIGSFLGLSLETVSRTFSLFQRQGLVTVNNRCIRLHDRDLFATRFEAVLQG